MSEKTQALVDRDDYLKLQLKAHELEKQLAQYKSIVKTVDPENLPESEVLAFCSATDDSLCGYLSLHDENIICEYKGVYKDNVFLGGITHYIEQKDLIELFGGDK